MRKTALVLFLAVFFASFILVGCGPQEGDPQSYRIGIVQHAVHDALDDAREGFIEALAEEGFVEGENIVIDIQNAQGEITTASTIAEGFVADGVDLILAIATPSAQATYNVTKEIPIVITAVTDPVVAGLANSLEKPGTNVTGTHDMNPIGEQIDLLREIFPEATNVGVIFNSSEENSLVQVELLEKKAAHEGLNIVKAPITATGEVSTAAESLVGKVDVIYIPTDNTVVEAIASVIAVSEEHRIPVIPGEESCIDKGSLATVGINYFKLGYQTGKMAAKILRGEAEPATMPIEGQSEYRVVINTDAAEKLGVELPQTVIERAGN